MNENLNNALENGIKNENNAVNAIGGKSKLPYKELYEKAIKDYCVSNNIHLTTAIQNKKYTDNPNYYVAIPESLKITAYNIKDEISLIFNQFNLEIDIKDYKLIDDGIDVNFIMCDNTYNLYIKHKDVNYFQELFKRYDENYTLFLDKQLLKLGEIKFIKKDKFNTSDYWYNFLYPNKEMRIMDPDGWNRQNYHYSYYEEKITLNQFLMRVGMSTCTHCFE